MIAALALDEGVGAAMTLEGAVASLAFNTQVQQVLVPKLRPGQVVVQGKLQLHKHQAVPERIQACGCELRFLASYSPDFGLDKAACSACASTGPVPQPP